MVGMSTATITRPAADTATARTAKLDQLRARLKAAGWSAQVVTLSADERAETVVEGYGQGGI
jgi:hypothetical protein